MKAVNPEEDVAQDGMGPIETQLHLTPEQLRELSGFDIEPENSAPVKTLSYAEEWAMEKLEVT